MTVMGQPPRRYPRATDILALADGWVHGASTDVADLVRQSSLEVGESFVMEGTIRWHRLPEDYRARDQ